MNPRDQLDKVQSTALSRMAKRASAAHQNNWEAFSYFAASAITAHICKVRLAADRTFIRSGVSSCSWMWPLIPRCRAPMTS